MHDRAGDETTVAGPSVESTDDMDGGSRALLAGLLLTVTLMALESLSVATVMPEVRADLGGYDLYGWVFSGFFLASIVGIVVGGPAVDRRGLVAPFVTGLVLFSVGLAVAGSAGSMEVLVAGRLFQGLGAGAVPAMSYAAIARGFSPAERPRIFAMLSTAWVVPGLIGPSLAAGVEHTVGWRWVFLGLLPVVGVVGALTVGPLRRVPSNRSDGGGESGQEATAESEPASPLTVGYLGRVLAMVGGVAAVLSAMTELSGPPALAAVVVGLPVAVRSFSSLVPPGTLRAAPGIPATIAVRGLLTWLFFQTDAYIPLTVVDGRGSSTFTAGAALSVASVAWAVGSWTQARAIASRGPRWLVGAGLVLVMMGAASALGVARGAPVVAVVIGWAVAGYGVGLAYAPLSVVVLGSARAGAEGTAAAALQLSDVLGVAVGTGLGGGVVALGESGNWELLDAVSVVFAGAILVGMVALAASRRIPAFAPLGTGAGS